MNNTPDSRARKGGPRTALGKKRSSRNAIKTGVFARVFNLTSQEQAEYREVRKALRAGLQPNTPLLELLFEDCVSCFWRMKLALRGEQVQSGKFHAAEHQEADKITSEQTVPLNFPFRLTQSEVIRRLKWLESLQHRLTSHPGLDPSLEKETKELFGEGFWKLLNDFTPTDPVAIIAGNLASTGEAISDLIRGSHPYDSPIPKVSEEKKREFITVQEFAFDRLREKLVDQQRHFYEQALQFFANREGISAGPQFTAVRLDLFIRYSTSARRDFYRAVSFYMEAKLNFA